MNKQTQSHLLMFSLMAVALFLPEFALADGDNPIETVLCNIVEIVNGPAGAAIATLAIIVIGLGALLGKVSWGMAIIVGLGIAIIFGAEAIVGLITGGDEVACDEGTGGLDDL